MRTCDIINELEDTELASKLRREYLVQGIDIERESYNLGTVIMSFNWGNGESERFWDKEYTKAANSNSKKYTKLNRADLIIDDEEDLDEEYEEDDYEEVV